MSYIRGLGEGETVNISPEDVKAGAEAVTAGAKAAAELAKLFASFTPPPAKPTVKPATKPATTTKPVTQTTFIQKRSNLPKYIMIGGGITAGLSVLASVFFLLSRKKRR